MAGLLDFYQFDPSSYQRNGLPGWLGAAFGTPISLSGTGFEQPIQSPPQPPGMGAAAGYGAGVDLPPNAAPVSGTLPPSAVNDIARAQAVQAAPQGPGVLDRLTAGATNFTTGGNPIAGFLNMISGLTTGARTDPAGMQAQTQLATYNALIPALVNSGLPVPQAQAIAKAAALNPEVMKTIAPQLYSKPEFKTIKNALGEDVPIFANAQNQTITYPTAPGGTAGAPGFGAMQQAFDKIEQARDAGTSNEQLLQMIPNSLREGVRAMLGGGVIPSNLSNRGAARDLTLRFAHAIDPTFDESLIPARVALQKSYQGGGKNFQETLALNTVGGHLLTLKNAAEGLGNTGFKPLNYLMNTGADLTVGSPALVRFRNALVTTQNELAKAYHGGHVSDAAFNAFNSAIGESQTPAELKAAIGQLSDLLSSKIQANETGYKTGMNGLPLPAQYRAINDEAKHSFDTINDWVRSGAKAAPAVQVSPAQQQLPKVATPADAARLPRGTHFLDPNGIERIVP